jgi:hypothetical protein
MLIHHQKLRLIASVVPSTGRGSARVVIARGPAPARTVLRP